MRTLAICLLAVVAISSSEGVPKSYLPADIKLVRDGLSGPANTTHYWDCCKPACGWQQSTGTMTKPVSACEIDGVTEVADKNTLSGCQGGTAFACTKLHSYAVNSTYAEGYASAFFGGVQENMCCLCFLLTFPGFSPQKKMLVQVINTGDDYDKNSVTFDLAVPGGGVGYYNACPTQWNSPPDGWGKRYGGVSSREECSELPKELSDFCTFRFDFFDNKDNPPATYQQVQCPAQLSNAAGCILG